MRPGILSSIALAGLALVAADATAVALNPRGIGEALVYPYYTVNKGQDTLISVLNTSDVGKVVTLRFREGYNGRPVLAFNLYLSAHDEWTGAVSATDGSDESGARLSTSDRSCIDSAASAPFPFSTAAFDGTDHPADGGSTTPARTREGYFELIAAGDIVPGSPTDIAITQIQTGQPNTGSPPGCDSLPGSVASDIVAPTSGLSGMASIVNVGEGTFYPYVADALTGFTDTPLIDAGKALSALEDANASRPGVTGVVADVLDNDGRTMTLAYARGIDAVSAVFMSEALFNEYLYDPALGAATDWIVTFPTRHAYVDKALYPGQNTSPFLIDADRHAALIGRTASYDREGWRSPISSWCAPLIPCASSVLTYLEHEVSVVGFTGYVELLNEPPSPVFGSRLAHFSSADGNGWIEMTWLSVYEEPLPGLPGGTRPGQAGNISLLGLPVTGFMAYNIINANAAPGRLANYGGTFRHRTRWSCVGDAAACE